MIIGCDIGGVVKDMISDKPIENAIKNIKELEKLGHNIIFISKCKEGYKKIISEWLTNNNLHNKVIFCEEYSQKNNICKKNEVNFMIDDKLSVLTNIDSNNITKIWFCSDSKKINGAKKFQPDMLSLVTICYSWEDIYNTIVNK